MAETFSGLCESVKADIIQQIDLEEEDTDLVGELYALRKIKKNILEQHEYDKSLLLADATKDRLWEYLNTGNWCDVPVQRRKFYAYASLFKGWLELERGPLGGEDEAEVVVRALEEVDAALLLGAGLHTPLTSLANLLNSKLTGLRGVPDLGEVSVTQEDWDVAGIKGVPVSLLHRPSLETFTSQLFHPRLPAKLTGCMEHWPALTKWRRLSYLVEVCGGRKVPVELGAKYTDDDWGMRLMTVSQLVDQHIVNPSASTKAYLAQHPLFHQVRELEEDIRVPEYCCLSQAEEEDTPGHEGPSVDTNAWFGPAGTVSPLHHDPKHNLLCQVLGRKRLLLFPPEDSAFLYPHEGRLVDNTASVDPEAPDYLTFPLLRQAHPIECHLHPGEMVYIPPKWWHHVRALDVSFSVSFWWQ